MPPWLNKNIIQAMSDRDRLKKERMFTENKTACLVDFCQQKTKGTDPFTIPLMAVHEMGKDISGINNKKSSGPNEISNQLLKHILPGH